MKLTKFVHACVLVEDEEHFALFDPGNYSWESGLFPLNRLAKLDYVIITHEHADHYSKPFVEALAQKFPEATFFSTQEVVSRLKQSGVTKALSLSHEDVTLKALEHESAAPLAPLPMCQNVAVIYKNKISHPGDSHHLTETKDILFLPIDAPWGSTVDAVRLADHLKPKVIVPVHDAMWNESWRVSMYDRLEAYFARQEIRFVKTVDGQPFEI